MKLTIKINYSPDDILLLKRMIEGANLRGTFFASNNGEMYGSSRYTEDDSKIEVGTHIGHKIYVDVYKNPIEYLKYIILTTSEIALSNSTEDNWRGFLDWYDFVFYVNKKDIPLYLGRPGLELLVEWRLKIRK